MIRLFWLTVITFHYLIVAVDVTLKFLAHIPRYIAKMTFEWPILVFALCIFANIFYPSSPYGDYIWIAPIASLLILMFAETFREPPTVHPRPHHHKHETTCENY